MLTVREFRSAVAAEVARPYEVLFASDRWTDRTAEVAHEIMDHGWEHGNFRRISVRPPIDWEAVTGGDRSWSFHLHSWDMLSPVLAAYEELSDRQFLDFAAAIACDWTANYSRIETPSEFAWYDMAIGVRGYRLGYILEMVSRDGEFDDNTVSILLDAASTHLDAFRRDDWFAEHSNHGFYFAAGQLALARRLHGFGSAHEHVEQASARVAEMIETQFGNDHVHREHSPDYHRMVLGTIKGLARAGLLGEAVDADKVQRIEETLAWFVEPDGSLVTFGDSPKHDVRDILSPAEISDPLLAFVVSQGRTGRPASERMRVFLDSGYAIMRSGWPRGTDDFDCWSYLAQTAAFHSRVHKHADDLSFVWFDQGREILIDPGRFGYAGRTGMDSELRREGFYYDDPRRMYVESTRAHNTIEIDERDFGRRKVRPYGSALRDAGEWGDILYTECEARHFGYMRHARMLLFRPARWLLVFDWVHDNNGEEHHVAQRYHFAPDIGVVKAGDGFLAKLDDGNRPLYVVSCAAATAEGPVKGQEEPRLLGWSAPQDGLFIATPSIAFVQSEVTTATFATLFAFGSEAPDVEKFRSPPSGRRFEVSWRAEDSRHRLTVERPANESPSIAYRIGGCR